MNVNNLLQALQQGVVRTDQRFVLTPDADFASKLTMGQVLKGKVLRHFEGNRYAVSFGGQEKVVDSAVPLRTGEILYGRVVGLDDKVQLQRVFPADEGAQKPVSFASTQSGFSPSSHEAAALRLFEQYQATLKLPDMQAMGKLMRSVPRPDLVAVSGLILSKIGLRLDSALLRSLYRVLSENKPTLPGRGEAAVALHAGESAPGSPMVPGVIERLAALLSARQSQERQQSAPRGDTDTEEVFTGGPVDDPDQGIPEHYGNDADSRGRREWELGRFLLNVQAGGSVAHRLRSFPIWFGGRLVEVDIALYSQSQQDHRQEGGIRYQKIVFSLNTDLLGHIEISVHVANRNLRLAITANDESVTGELARYLPDLKAALSESGWRLDEISYETVENDVSGNVLGSVVEHYISQDSLSRLM